MSTALPPSLADFCGVLSESKRILHAHSRHFLALAVLFLLPLSFSLSVFPILPHSFSSSHGRHTLLRHNSLLSPHHHHLRRLQIPFHSLIFLLIFSLISLLLLLSAAASLTFSVFHGFYGRPVKLAAALSSLSRSFLPLLATFSAALLSATFSIAAYALCEFLAWKAFILIAGVSQSPLDSGIFLAISSIGALILALVLTDLAVNWILASAVVVVESRWGFDGLIRSKKLVNRMRRTALSLILFFGIAAALLLWISWVSSSAASAEDGGGSAVFSSRFTTTIGLGDWWRNWAIVTQIVVTSSVLTAILLHGIAAITVFYMYCKAVRGELADEIAKEFANEYLSLPFDGERIPYLVSVIQH